MYTSIEGDGQQALAAQHAQQPQWAQACGTSVPTHLHCLPFWELWELSEALFLDLYSTPPQHKNGKLANKLAELHLTLVDWWKLTGLLV